MRNKINLSSDPQDMFLNPWQDEGLKLLASPEFLWRERPAARITGFAASAHEELNERIRGFVETARRQRTYRAAIEVNTLPVVIDQADFRKASLLAEGKLVLSGASGTRLLNAYRWEFENAGFDPDTELSAYFAQCQEANADRDLPLETTFLENDVDFALECRNTFNFYHFMAEALPQLTVLDAIGFAGNIYFHYPNSEDKRRPFAEAFVDALFPEFVGRVFFERAPKEYPLVLTAFDLTIALGQAPKAVIAGLDKLAPGQTADLSSADGQVVFAMNAVSTALLALRERALKLVEPHDFSHLPKRFFVVRDEQTSRSRPLEGEDHLFEQLAGIGFEKVVFETLTPLEQVAIMAQAEAMVASHGAGFANMLFAHPDAFVIELGTLQTARYRWKDFWPLAHAAQCSYVTFFADFNADDPLLEPKFDEDGIVPVSISEQAVGQIAAFTQTVLGHPPQIDDHAKLHQLGRRVLRAGAALAAVTLLEAHGPLVEGDLDLCLLLADCHKEMGETKSELIALDMAYTADPARWQTLIRIFWCASSCERPQVVRWALGLLETEFPDRYETFVNNHAWVRFVA